MLGAATLLCVLWAGVLACHTITEEVEPTLLPAVKHDLHCMYSIFELVKGAPLCVKFLHVCIVISVRSNVSVKRLRQASSDGLLWTMLSGCVTCYICYICRR